jgi:LAO/AO transport system kinase
MFSSQDKKVGIIAVDPTSAKGSGALLGDRVRMREAEKMKGIFIRSMAHRGYPGGVAKATIGATYILEALGKDTILIESVGAGQTEIQISSLCDTIITLFTPDYGDEIQLMKAGLIEIGDIIVVNKIDRPQAEETVHDLKTFVGEQKYNGWHIPVLAIQALKGEGIENLISAINVHYQYLHAEARRERRKKEKIKTLMFALLKEEVWIRLIERWSQEKMFKDITTHLQEGKIDPYRAVELALEIINTREAAKEVSQKHP